MLQCVIEGPVPPFSLMWSSNGMVLKKKDFNCSATTYLLELPHSFRNVKTHSVVTCSSEGLYLKNDSTSLQLYLIEGKIVEKSNLAPPDDINSSINIQFILILSGSSAVILIVVLCIIKGVWTCQRDHLVEDALSSIQGGGDETTFDQYYYVEESESKQHSSSGQMDNNVAVFLDTKVSVHGLYEYFSGTYSLDSSVQGKCLAKQLSDQGTLQEASQFKLLARKLLTLQKSSYVITLLTINIETEPYSIVYELLEYGSLRDFVLARYQQWDIDDEVKTSFTKELKELLAFAVNVAGAMAFIHSQEFCHPFISLKKVLLTSECACKLYDIRPNDMAMIKVTEVFKRSNPPTAWIPPETIFLREYTPACDAWSFSVLLWELFTLGNTPYAGNTTAEIENIIREGKRLPQPLNCPSSVYEIMDLSWQKVVKKRPPFALLHRKLGDILKTVQAADDKERKGTCYSTLNPHECEDFI